MSYRVSERLKYASVVRIIFFFLLVLFCQLQQSQISFAEAYKDGLYSSEDDVLPLNNVTLLNRVLKNKENVFWVVEFYNSWCGHCIKFAPTWKKLASSLKGWNDLVRIAALDCSQSINLASCRKLEIEGYPTIKMFAPTPAKNSTSKSRQVMRQMNKRDLEPMTSAIVNFMTEFALPTWPRLQPLRAIEDIWSEKKNNHKYVTLIFEEATSQVGRKVLLDMRKTPNVLVRTLLSESVKKYGVKQFPSLYELKEDSTFRLLGIGNKNAAQDRELFVKMLQVLSRGEGDKLDFSLAQKKDSLTKKKQEQDAASKDQKSLNPDEAMSSLSSQNKSLRVSMQDLESALHYGFRQEIAICKTIEGQKFNALQSFVQVLLKYFPGRGPIMRFLKSVNNMLTSSVTGNHLSGEEWIIKIDDLQTSESFLPDVIQWDCCQGSMPRYRGYPCAMWTLFHVLTVSAYAQHSHSGRPSNPMEVPLAIRGYMEHFFGCAECSQHFLSMAASMEQEIADAKSAVLWLWSAHNKANRRLKGDESEDKMFPKVQFPATSLCEKCHSLQETNSSEPIWNMEIVFKFLISFYIEKNIYVSTELSQRGFHSSKVDENGKESGLKSNQMRDITTRHGELDWWEGKQREQDLKKVRLLRERKREKNRKSDVGVVERLVAGNFPTDEQGFAVYKMKGEGANKGGLFSDLDLSMCVVFYVISTVIILGLYHHFIIRKKTSPCPTNCLR